MIYPLLDTTTLHPTSEEAARIREALSRCYVVCDLAPLSMKLSVRAFFSLNALLLKT
jgi:hypothetical protein